MRTQKSDPLSERLRVIESKLDTLSFRLDALEQAAPGRPERFSNLDHATQAATAWVKPPPVMFEPPVAPAAKPQAVPPTVATQAAKPVDDIEYKIGLTGLLRGGAVVVIVGILYLVGLAISRGYITPQMQFIGELALCGAFITFGLVKRNMREDFGQLMIGIGSCGLYLSVAGGHVYKNLYSGEVLVGLFMALSFANLGFALWKSSKSFLALGFLGGFIAAMLPMREHHVQLDVILHLLILIPSAILAARNRWSGMAILVWVASTLALVPAFTFDQHWVWRLVAIYASSLICAVAYAFSYSDNDFDPWCAFAPFVVIFGGLAGLALDEAQRGSLHVLLLSAAVAGVAIFLKGKPRNALLVGAIAAAVTIAPMGFSRVEAAFAYAALSVVIGFSALRFSPKVTSSLAWTEFLLAVTAYLYVAIWQGLTAPLPVSIEAPMLVAFMAAIAASAFATNRSGGQTESMFLVGGLIALPAFCRFGFVLLSLRPVEPMQALAIIAPVFMFSMAAITLGAQRKWDSIIALGWATLFVSMICYLNLALNTTLATSFDAGVVLALMAATVYGAYGVQRCSKNQGEQSRDFTIGIPGAIVGVFIVRLAVVLFAVPHGALTSTSAIACGSLVAVGFAGLSYLFLRWRAGVFLAWCFLALSCSTSLALSEAVEPGMAIEKQLLAACLAAILFVGYATARLTTERKTLLSFCIASFWVVYTRLLYLLLTSSAIGLKDAAAITVAWIVLATALIVLGFVYQVRYLRYWSFAVFGATIFKVFLMDLAGLDPGIRVVILLGLGLCMVGGGYWYIRQHQDNLPPGDVPLSGGVP